MPDESTMDRVERTLALIAQRQALTVKIAPTYHTELIDGAEVEKPLTKNLHSLIQSYLVGFFRLQLPTYRVMPELNVLCGSDRLVPDLVITKHGAKYIDGDLAEAPLLAIEIISPGQTLGQLLDRCERLLKAGTPLCWVILPERKQAWSYVKENFTQATAQLIFTLPDHKIIIPLNEMWKELEEE